MANRFAAFNLEALAGNAAKFCQFTAKERDSESGLDYFGARYYGSALRRFTSPDAPFADQHPEDPQSWNMYAYVRNNPLKNTDPDGRDCTDGVSACLNYIAGGLKALGNVPTDVFNAPTTVVNAALSLTPTSYRFTNLFDPLFTANGPDQRQGMEAANAVMLVTPVAEAGAAKAAEVLGSAAKAETAASAITADVPTSIPAGPSARPTAAQQRAINEMGDAHGCSTCGATTPGTTSGNWVGDHQPPTALNPPGGDKSISHSAFNAAVNKVDRLPLRQRRRRRRHAPLIQMGHVSRRRLHNRGVLNLAATV